jgi:hypothetical protein
MENGLPIEDPESGYNPMSPWSNEIPGSISILFSMEIRSLKN